MINILKQVYINSEQFLLLQRTLIYLFQHKKYYKEKLLKESGVLLRILIIINKIGKQISTIEMTKTKARNIKNIIIGITIKKKK